MHLVITAPQAVALSALFDAGATQAVVTAHGNGPWWLDVQLRFNRARSEQHVVDCAGVATQLVDR